MGAQTATSPAPAPELVGVPVTDEPFEAFYRATVDGIYRALALTLGDPQLAREATDEAMARAYAHWRRVRHLDNPGGWAYRVGLNWATSWWRKVRRERTLTDDRREQLVAPPPDPPDIAAQQALAALALPQRAVVVCRVLLDLSTAETAAVLGVAEGTRQEPPGPGTASAALLTHRVLTHRVRASRVRANRVRTHRIRTTGAVMTRTDLPDDLVAAVRGAAHSVPPHPGDLAGVRARGGARRRRRSWAVAGAAALAAAAAVGAPFALDASAGGPAADPPPPGPVEPAAAEPATEPATEPAQRLLLDGAGDIRVTGDGEELDPPAGARAAYDYYRSLPGAAGVIGPPAEVLPGGDLVDLDLDLPGIDGINGLVAMPDGRLAVLGLVDRMPGVARIDGPCVEGLDLPLLVVEADGSVSTSRDVRVMCESVLLLAADADTAYLVRDDTRLVAHDLATGAERALADFPAGLEQGPYSYAGGRAVMVLSEPAGGECASGGPTVRMSVWVADVATGTSVTHQLPGDGCYEWATRVRVSPDGRHAAVAYDRIVADGDGRQLEVRVVDLTDGTPVAALTVEAGEPQTAVAGMAWDDAATVRLAWYPVPDQGMSWLADVVEVETVLIP